MNAIKAIGLVNIVNREQGRNGSFWINELTVIR